MKTMYDRIRDLRISRGMSQDDLAQAMGYKDRSMITKIESGAVDIAQSKIYGFAKVLGTTTRYLMDGDTQEIDRDRLEALHQRPALGMLFDRTRNMSDEDIDFMIQFADRIAKERER